MNTSLASDAAHLEVQMFVILDQVSNLVFLHNQAHNFNGLLTEIIADFYRQFDFLASNTTHESMSSLDKKNLLNQFERLTTVSRSFHLENIKSKMASNIEIKSTLKNINQIVMMVRKNILELEHHSLHDPLTNLYNLRHFREEFDMEIKRSCRSKCTFTIIYADIDKFKHINDTYGHATGDLVLIKLSKNIARCCRQYDVVCRLGGDEFAIIFPETNLNTCKMIAEKIRSAISQIEFNDETGKLFQVTISIGIVQYPLDGKNIRSLMLKADAALYSAKERGQNKIVCSKKV